jgi:hypothetical protein
MPYGLFSFRIDGLTVDYNNPTTVNITFYFTDTIPSDAKWYKYDSADGALLDDTSHIIISGKKVVLSITDGDSGDQDETVNGIIIDPSGPAFTVSDIDTVSTPTFSPSSSTYTSSQSVSISCATSDVTIRYTTNGTEPTESSAVYSSAITVSSTTTIKAKAFKTDWTASDTATATYTINISSPAPSDGGGGGGGSGIFGEIDLSDVIGYHFDGTRGDETRIYMPVTQGFKALKGAQTHIEKFAPRLSNLIRRGFDSLERIAEANKDGILYWVGTHIFPVLGKIAEFYLDIVDSEELMNNAYSDTMISVDEFNQLHEQGIVTSSHIVKCQDKLQKRDNFSIEEKEKPE